VTFSDVLDVDKTRSTKFIGTLFFNPPILAFSWIEHSNYSKFYGEMASSNKSLRLKKPIFLESKSFYVQKF